MRARRAVLALAAVAALAAPPAPLAITGIQISQSDGGEPLPPGFTHVPGEILFMSFLVEGYKASPEQKVHLSYKITATDPSGVAMMEPVESVVDAELTPQDKDWKPKIRHEIQIPPLAPSGAYKIAVTVTDDLAKTSVSKDIPFTVQGHDVPPSDTLVIRNFRFYRSEEGGEPLPKAVYRPGDPVWARFDITGYKFGQGHSLEVTYGIAVVAPSGKVLMSQADAATEKKQSFYPQHYVPSSFGFNLQPNIRPGDYTVVITARDAIGKQTAEAKEIFTVEQ